MGKSCFCKQIKGSIIVNFPFVNYSAVAVVSVLAEAYICYYSNVRNSVLNSFNSFLHNSVLCIGTGSKRVFFVGKPEKHDGRNAEVIGLLYGFNKHVTGKMKLSWHGFNGGFYPFSFHGKQRVDEIIN